MMCSQALTARPSDLFSTPLLALMESSSNLDRPWSLPPIQVCGPTLTREAQKPNDIIHTASHLHFADHIVVLSEDGTIAEQGTLDEVSSSGGYVQKLAGLPPPSTSRPELELSEETLEELELPDEDEEADSSRKAGDLKVYNYYIQIAGPWTFWFYIAACAAFIFGLSFPCESTFTDRLLAKLSYQYYHSYLATMVDRCQHCSSQREGGILARCLCCPGRLGY